ncbi:MAG: CoA transferase [Pseudomonadota bacterium]
MAIEGALKGIRVLDLTNVLSGPYACYLLGLMGAEVIKVERPGTGDFARQLGADPDLNARGFGVSFLAQNAGKRSVSLNLKHPEGAALFKRLVERADVVVENNRPGVMERLGLSYEVLRGVNPHLIHCAISGFGQTGPMRDDPAYDQIVQGIAGVMALTGDQQSAPLRVGYPMADTIAGLMAAFSIASALNANPRGAFLDVAMTEAVLSTMGWAVSNFLIAGQVPGTLGNENPATAPSGTFQTADAPINIAANRDDHWQALVRHLRREELLTHPDYATREDRKRNRHALRAALEEALTTRPAAAWVEELNRLGIPSGPVLSVPETLASEQIEGRGLLSRHTSAVGEIAVVASPVVVDGTRPAAESPPPPLGADNASVYGELGLDTAEIERLTAEGVL